MKPQLTSAFALFAMALTGCESMSAGQPEPTPQMSDADREAVSERKKAIIGALSAYEGVYDVSEAAMATAVLDEDGEPVGLLAYASPVEAIKAGDGPVPACRRDPLTSIAAPTRTMISLDIVAGRSPYGLAASIEKAKPDCHIIGLGAKRMPRSNPR